MNPLPGLDSVRALRGFGQRPPQQPRGDADAFQEALQQDADADLGARAGRSADAPAETPAARRLQPRPPASRNTGTGAVRHVDVLA